MRLLICGRDENRDPRLTQTIRAAGYVRDDGKKYLPNFKLAKLGII